MGGEHVDTTTSAYRLTVPFLPVGAALFCIQLDFFSLNLALPTIATGVGAALIYAAAGHR